MRLAKLADTHERDLIFVADLQPSSATWPRSTSPSVIVKFVCPTTILREERLSNLVAADSIKKILNLNHEPEELSDSHADTNASNGITSTPILNSDGDPIWKILVFDDLGRDVISSVLRVNDLRAWGVTMHMFVSPSRNRSLVARKINVWS